MQYGVVNFTIESRILKELGERLVSDAPVALTELIKNSHDADANECRVFINNEKIIVSDDGHGMTFEEFSKRWMTIATNNKATHQYSRKYHRKLTGSKGIGRFAVRFLGEHLLLETVSEENGKRTKLTANFDWVDLDKETNILDLQVPYSIEETSQKCSTTLTITKLRKEIVSQQIKTVKSNILGTTSPLYAFIQDASNTAKNSILHDLDRKDIDTGFKVTFSDSDFKSDKFEEENLAATVLENFVLRAQMSLIGDQLEIKIDHKYTELPKIKIFKLRIKNLINSNVYSDIRFFPRRAGVFTNKGINGLNAWSWVRANSGVKVYDHGFGISPYGYEDDDWIWLNQDTAHSGRNWRTNLMQEHFPMDLEMVKSPKYNPMVGLPTNYQTIGAVFVQSSASDDDSETALVPSMDRQGYVTNLAFDQLREIVRFAVELIAYYDKKLIREVERLRRDKLYDSQREEIDAVVREIRSSPTLISEDKERIIDHYIRIKENVEELGDYDKEARESLELMSLLGVVAGFMTHEYQAALMDLEKAVEVIRKLAKNNSELLTYAEDIDNIIDNFTGYIDYTRLFVENIHLPTIQQYTVMSVVKHVTSTFKKFQEERDIQIDVNSIDPKLNAPLIPSAMYQGIIHNLYTNALKALLNDYGDNKTIMIQAWNDNKKHIIQVIDNGPGIPDEVKNRIWDPLYTTTSSENNPLGSGMGLGLPLVKRVVESKKGKIMLVQAPPGFSTCFRVELPRGNNGL